MNQLLLLLFTALVSSTTFGNADLSLPQSSIQNTDVSLEDFLRIQGTYKVKTEYVFPTANGRDSIDYQPMNTFVLMYSPKTQSLMAAFSDADNGNGSPVVAFRNLESHYSLANPDSIILKGYGGGHEMGRLVMRIDIQSGQLEAQFSDTVATGVKNITGQRAFNIDEKIALIAFDTPLTADDYTGIYETRDIDEVACPNASNKDKKKHWKLIIRTDVLPGPSVSLTSGLNFKLDHQDSRGESCEGINIKFEVGNFVPELGMFEFALQNNSGAVLKAGVMNVFVDIEDPQKLHIHFFNFNGQSRYRVFYKIGDVIKLDRSYD